MTVENARALVNGYLEIHNSQISEPDFSNWLSALGNSEPGCCGKWLRSEDFGGIAQPPKITLPRNRARPASEPS
jgi:hypothetical protein